MFIVLERDVLDMVPCTWYDCTNREHVEGGSRMKITHFVWSIFATLVSGVLFMYTYDLSPGTVSLHPSNNIYHQGGNLSVQTDKTKGLTAQQPLTISIKGPPRGIVRQFYTFNANVTPVTTTTPLTYIWYVTDRVPEIYTTDNITNEVSYTWYTTGTKTLTVTVSNEQGIVASHPHTIQISLQPVPVPPERVTLQGPQWVVVNEQQTYNTSVEPSDTTTPIFYTWYINGKQSKPPGLEPSNTFPFVSTGTYSLSVQAYNTYGQVQTSLPVEVHNPTLSSNHASGKPGSFFTITANDFPPDTSMAIQINGSSLSTIQTESDGTAIFVADSTGADIGTYTISAITSNPSASREVTLELLTDGTDHQTYPTDKPVVKLALHKIFLPMFMR